MVSKGTPRDEYESDNNLRATNQNPYRVTAGPRLLVFLIRFIQVAVRVTGAKVNNRDKMHFNMPE